MSLETTISPINKDHSIKEAVISLFLASPIIKPERFQQLIENDFKDTFQKFENVSQFEFQVQNILGSSPMLNQQVMQNAGFKFLAFDKGNNVKVLQGINEKVRNFVSYHSLNYTRWKQFYEDYSNVISVISKFHPEFFVTAFSLHYIDQFLWISEKGIDLDLVFKKDVNYIPNEFFNSSVNNYSIITEKELDGYINIDRLEINIDRKIRPMISISHNVTRPLNDVIQLKDLLEGDTFSKILNACHLHNKEILSEILTPEVKDIIKLKLDSHEQ
jgi:uncharacterized protein (TIGR04255 family)